MRSIGKNEVKRVKTANLLFRIKLSFHRLEFMSTHFRVRVERCLYSERALFEPKEHVDMSVDYSRSFSIRSVY